MALAELNGEPSQPPERCFRRRPAIRAMRSSSLGQAYRWTTGFSRIPAAEREMWLSSIVCVAAS